MGHITRRTEPDVVDGRLFTGLLTIDHAGRIDSIGLLVDGILITRDDASAREAAGITEATEIRMRQVLKSKHRANLHPDLLAE
jgi:hypothetical protein